MKNYWTIKEGEAEYKDMSFANPFLGIIFYYVVAWANERELPVRITSIFGSAPDRISRTHIEGRAIDIGIRGWRTKDIKELQRKMNLLYRDWGTAPQGKPPQVFVYGDSRHLDHVHLQVRRNIKLD